MDPTGILSFAGELFLGKIFKFGHDLPFSRESESEADRLGLHIMVC